MYLVLKNMQKELVDTHPYLCKAPHRINGLQHCVQLEMGLGIYFKSKYCLELVFS